MRTLSIACLCLAAAGCGPTCLSGPEVSGELVIADRASGAYDRARWEGSHKQDIDPEEDGCLANVTVIFEQGGEEACPLAVGVATDGAGGFRVYSLDVTALSDCRDFPDANEDVYRLAEDSGPVTVTGLPAAVPEDNADATCFTAEVTFDGVATLVPEGGAAEPTLTIDFSGVTLSGGLPSTGWSGASCTEP